MFTCEDYRLLDEGLQARLLWLDGIFLLARKTERVKAELFSLYGFYVEVFFADNDEMLFIKSFEGINGLGVYLELINIEPVLTSMK
jgi:hypothetical protein